MSIGPFEDTDHLKQPPCDVLRNMKKVKPGHTALEYDSVGTMVLELIVNEVFGDRV